MCIIIDANRLGAFLEKPPGDDMAPVHKWLREQGGQLVYASSGKFADEITPKARHRLAEYKIAGAARLVKAEDITAELQKIDKKRLRSNDAHIIALALASGARLLCSDDGKLRDDFRDGSILKDPRGRIYSGARNKNLLTPETCRNDKKT